MAFALLGLWAAFAAARGLPGEHDNPFWILLPVAPIFLILGYRLRDRGQRYTRATHDLIDRARDGDPEACFQLAAQYLGGEADLHRDDASGRHWLERAVDAGHPKAMIRLAGMLREGQGGGKDPLRAQALLERARLMERPKAGPIRTGPAG
ncbi:tetratricopeptide repeat protein [Geothrix sp. 21YS21S-2]|uniref:tetratricopeptide repeat protein n=1 Tax=Geothrix sp. 21YS21S-2 TaxID=3068893 RepID=UPI0027B9CD75|nr:hypothetical protein [Geothrix sp. 21YS21S-2]